MIRALVPVLFALAVAEPAARGASRGQEGGVPLVKDLVIVTAVQWPDGDYESLKRVVAVSARDVTVTVSAETPSGDGGALAGLFGGSEGARAKPRRVNARRIVLREDLQNARQYVQRFREDAPATLPGTTAIGVSASVLNELKGKGATRLAVVDQRPAADPAEGLLGLLAGDDASDRATLSGTLRLVAAGAKTVTVLVNGTPTALPVVHARGELGGVQAELVLLDDPANPLALRYAFGDVRLEVVRLEFPVAAAAAPGPQALERQLAATGKVEIYGIYFDFASDRIKPESEPVLREIARVLTANPTWTLSIDGHTDNVGGERFNLELSRRRATSVKQALTGSYKVNAARLSTRGFGAGQPKETNDTLPGRARNRRVELVRQP